MNKTITLGENVSFRKFRNLNDLLIYLEDLQKTYKFDLYHETCSPYGIMRQVMKIDNEKNKDKKEVYVYFTEEDPEATTERKFYIHSLWINRETREVLDEPPDWFIKQKKDLISKWN
jgi:hypothetical protein